MDQELDEKPKFLGLALSARRNLCIHPRVWSIFSNTVPANFIRLVRNITILFITNSVYTLGTDSKFQVSEETKSTVVDAKCREMTSSWVREAAGVQVEGEEEHSRPAQLDKSIELCDYYE